MLHCAEVFKVALMNTYGWIKIKWMVSAGKWLPPLLSALTFLPNTSSALPQTNAVLPFPILLFPIWGMISYLLSFPWHACCLLLPIVLPQVALREAVNGLCMPQRSHRLSASLSGMCLMGMVVWWSWFGGHLKTTRPYIEGLDKKKGYMRALWQHGLPLINGRFRVESKSDETLNKAVIKMCCRIHSMVTLLGSEYHVANSFCIAVD